MNGEKDIKDYPVPRTFYFNSNKNDCLQEILENKFFLKKIEQENIWKFEMKKLYLNCKKKDEKDRKFFEIMNLDFARRMRRAGRFGLVRNAVKHGAQRTPQHPDPQGRAQRKQKINKMFPKKQYTSQLRCQRKYSYLSSQRNKCSEYGYGQLAISLQGW